MPFAMKVTHRGYQDSTGHRSPLDALDSQDDQTRTPEQTNVY